VRARARPPSEVLRLQRAAAESLRREVLGEVDARGYFRDFRRHVRGHRRELTDQALASACADSDILYLGEFHPLLICQRFAADLLASLAARGRSTILGVEFVYTRQQPLLDRRQLGELDDRAFLRRIHYREEWGYPWEGYRDLLDRARALGVPVRALDATPRAGVGALRRRDEHAARQIETIVERHPGARLVVLFGESHLSPNHIPAKVATLLARKGLARRAVTIYQSPDEVYWSVASVPPPHPRVVEVAERVYAVLSATPLEKYEAYRQVLERWRDDVPPDEEVDLTPAVHHLIHALLGWLGIRRYRFRVRHRAGWDDELSDTLPEVYGGPEASDILPEVLAEHRRTGPEIAEATATLARRGALYDSRANVMFLTRYLPGPAAAEGARYLRAALSGRLYDPPEETWADPAARAYGAAYNEALAYLGARLVDPSGDALTGDEVQALRDAGVDNGTDVAQIEARVRWLAAHRLAEQSGRRSPGQELLAPLRADRPLRRALSKELGHRLGRVLLDRVRRGELEGRRLRELFARPLDATSAPKRVFELLRQER